MFNISINYNGKYPTLCMGKLIVTIGDKEWIFPDYCLSSGGSASFDDEWNEEISDGPWVIQKWPEDFPEMFKDDVLEAFNAKIPHGCCGGCL